jgi:hypothetical protein
MANIKVLFLSASEEITRAKFAKRSENAPDEFVLLSQDEWT